MKAFKKTVSIKVNLKYKIIFFLLKVFDVWLLTKRQKAHLQKFVI
jgi:hypothetical protein